MKKFFRRLTFYTAAGLLFILFLGGAAAFLTPHSLTMSSDCDMSFCCFPLSLDAEAPQAAADSSTDTVTSGTLKLFGLIPVKNVDMTFTERPLVHIGGEPFGIRLYTDGLIVSRISDIPTSEGTKFPAKEAGINVGDTILSVNGTKLKTNEQLLDAVEQSGGKPLRISIHSEGGTRNTTITPVTDSQLGKLRIGLWIRDSCAGIGTLTFSDPFSHTLAGLGHGITDSESGSIMPLLEGDIVKAGIYSVQKGTGGCPGALCGFFSDNSPVGEISANDECGIFGTYNERFGSGRLMPVAFRQEAVRGPAKLRTTVSESAPEEYDVYIEEISYNNSNITKNMVIHITDQRLLDKTGGIVQGMSGSPIIQNGRLVGAVTHVFINDPSRGYAVFAENMTDFNNNLIRKQAVS